MRSELLHLKLETISCRNTVSCCAMCVVTTEKRSDNLSDKTYVIRVLVEAS